MGILSMQEFGKEALLGYINERQYPVIDALVSHMPKDEQAFDLDFAYDMIGTAKNPAAAIRPFGAVAPLRDGGEVKRIVQEVAKLQNARRIDERDQIRFMHPRSDAERQQVFKRVFDIVDDLVMGTNRMEAYLRAAAIYKGKLVYNHNGTNLDIDFGIPAENKVVLTGTDLFSDHANAKPLEVLIEYARTFADKNGGLAPSAINVSRDVLWDITKCKNTIDNIKGINQGAVTIEEVNQFLNRFGLPNLTVDDYTIYFEETGTTERLLPVRRIAFIGVQNEAAVGSLVEGPTAKNNFQPGRYVDTIIDEHTSNETIEIGEAVFPALKYPSAVFHIDA
jgi:hypothetical protein